MANLYQVLYYNPLGVLVDKPPFTYLDYARKVNEVGTLTMQIPANKYNVGFFQRDGIISVYRSVNSGASYELDMETSWTIRRARYARDQSGNEVAELTAYDTLYLLNRRIAAYLAGTSYTAKLDYADDAMKDTIRENYGAAALDAARDFSANLSVAADTSTGIIIGKNYSFMNIFGVLREMANESAARGVKLFFDVVQIAPLRYEFRTYPNFRGVNHGAGTANQVIIALENGNLSMPELIFDWTEERNYVYAGGKGDGDIRPVEEAADYTSINSSIFNRNEVFVNVSNSDDTAYIQDEADNALYANRARVYFSGRILDTPGTRYGVNYKYGDVVNAKYKGYSIDCRIDTMHVTIDQQNGEVLDPRIYGESTLDLTA